MDLFTSQIEEDTNVKKPQKGMQVEYKDPFTGEELTGTVVRVEGNLCWTKYDGKDEVLPFIWRFHDGYNTFHKWS